MLQGGNQRGRRNEGKSQEVVAGERGYAGGCGRGGVCGGCLRSLRSSCYFLCRLLRYLVFVCVRDGVLGFLVSVFFCMRDYFGGVLLGSLFNVFHQRAHSKASAMASVPLRSLFSSMICVMRKLQIVTGLDRLKFSLIELQLDTSKYSGQ